MGTLRDLRACGRKKLVDNNKQDIDGMGSIRGEKRREEVKEFPSDLLGKRNLN